MAKVSKAFDSKLKVYLDSRVGRQLAQFEDMSACAGIKGDSWNAYKAKINHYGGTVNYRRSSIKVVGKRANGKARVRSVVTKKEIRIPARPFMDVPLERDTYLLNEFEKEVARVLSGGHGRSYTLIQGYKENDSPSQMTSSGGASSTLRKIAKVLADCQRSAIQIATPPNAEATIRKKGFDAPLRETYEMFDTIKGWVE